MRNKNWWGFDTKGMNTKVRPQDNFFEYANGTWIKQNPIPDDESRWGAFLKLRYTTDKQIKVILEEVSKKRRIPKGSEEQLIRDFYLSGMDMKKRNALGLAPLEILRKKIKNITDLDDLRSVIVFLSKKGSTVPWDIDVDQDLKNSTKNILYVGQSGLGMPDRDYYLKDDKDSVRVRNAYKKHIKTVFVLTGHTPLESQKRMEVVMQIETKLATAAMSKVEMRDPDNIYHKKTVTELQKLAPAILWKEYFNGMGIAKPGNIIVMQPAFFKEVNRMLKTHSIDEWQIYLEWHVVNDFASFLSQPFINENFAFYGKVLSGDKKMRPLWRRVSKVVEGNLGEVLGKLYVKKHFGEKEKAAMNELIDNLFVAFEKRLKEIDWMSETTKKQAFKKLRAMNRKIGYPDKWKSYRGLNILKENYVGNVIASHEFEHKRVMKKIGKPIDKHEWHMYPQTVNAYYSMTMNEIVFPAAILQYPFFDINADAAVNYGAIGYVIGHEITHGFDDQGSKFDAKGNLKSWWKPSDKKRFDAKAKTLEKQFNEYIVAPGIHVNGKLTLGENIADLGGVAIAYDAYQEHLKTTEREDIDGFSPEERFFLGLAQGDREHARKEYLKTIVKIDPHSPSEFRVNGPTSNLDIFYEIFSVTKNDKLYRPPKKRAQIW